MKILSLEYQGSFCAIASGLLYGLVGYFGMNLMNSNMSVANMQFWRFLISAIFIGLILIWQIKSFREKKVEMLKAFLAGALFYSISGGVYFLGCQYIGTGLAMVIFFTFPVFVMLLNWLIYKINISKISYFAVVLIAIGMIQLSDLGELKFDIIGMGLSILGAILYACYIIASKTIKTSPLVATLMISLGCSFACLLFALWDQHFFIPATFTQWRHIVGFGVISTALPMLFLLKGLKYISTEKVSLLSVLEPVFVVIFGILLLNEKLSLLQTIGMMTVLTGALITVFSRNLESFPMYQKFYRSFKQRFTLSKSLS